MSMPIVATAVPKMPPMAALEGSFANACEPS
jgi:hypothetical protein